MRSKYILIAVVLVALAFGVGRLSAAVGTLDSPDVPANTQSFTLNDIYNRLDTGAEDGPSAFTEPAAGPGTGTMHDLNEIMGKAPAVDDTHGVTQTYVLTGTTFWGLTSGQWGAMIGTMPNNGAVTIVPTTTNQTIAMGYHSGSGHVEGDADLVASKIKSSVDIFGVTGTVIEATGNATAGDVLTGKTFSNASAAGIAGAMPDREGDNASTAQARPGTVSYFTAPEGYYDGNDRVSATDAQVAALDTDITAGNIKSGVDIFGVTGTLANADPPCFDNANRYVDCGNGTVHDTVTNLIWLKNANCYGELDYAAANNAAAGLEDGECGLTDGSSPGDWRLPTHAEWEATIERAVALGCTFGNAPSLTNTPGTACYSVGPQPFIGVQSDQESDDRYWSSTTYAVITGSAWNVSLFGGPMGAGDKPWSLYVWPVRGGQ